MQINNEQVQRIGNGQFMVAYRGTESGKVYLKAKTDDVCLHEMYTMVSGKHIPTLESIEYNIYSAPFYVKPKAGSEAKKLATKLAKLREEYMNKNSFFSKEHKQVTYNYWYGFLAFLQDKDIPESILEDLDTIITWSHNYYDRVCLEFQLRNVAETEDGTLVLRDIVFPLSR